MDLPADLITTSEAAKIARAHVVAVHRWVKSGLIRGWRRAGRLFVSKAEVEAMYEPVVPTKVTRREAIQRRHSQIIAHEKAVVELKEQGFMV